MATHNCVVLCLCILAAQAKMQLNGNWKCPEENLNISGRSQLGAPSKVNSWEECAAKCAKEKACELWTWVRATGGAYARNCALMSAAKQTVHDRNVISGAKTCKAGELSRTVFISKPENISAKIGDTVEFPCVTENTGDSVVTWTLNGSRLLSAGSMKVTAEKRLAVVGKGRSIRINDVQQEDGGLYQCQVYLQSSTPSLEHVLHVVEASDEESQELDLKTLLDLLQIEHLDVKQVLQIQGKQLKNIRKCISQALKPSDVENPWSSWLYENCHETLIERQTVLGGSGHRSRSREVRSSLNDPWRNVTLLEACQQCNASRAPVPIDCSLSPWSLWSACSVSCDGGVQSRARQVLQEAMHGGEDCDVERSQKQQCAEEDCPPRTHVFNVKHYTADIYEDQDIGSLVIEVKADTEASLTTYSIKQGNFLHTFKIDSQPGYIRVNKPLDYESIKEYRLIVQAWDGQFSSNTNVQINILNRNDMKPMFANKNYQIDFTEEIVPSFVILQVSATDPDIEDQYADQNITYFLDQTNAISNHFKINAETGDLTIVKPLDRDLPDGFPKWTMYVFAKDENGAASGLENFVEVTIDLEDINDNAPFLNMPDGLVTYENSEPGLVEKLEAQDFDEEKNGPPFTFEIDPNASQDIKSKFSIKKKANGDYWLKTETTFDRESQKQYKIPIKISDNQGLSDISTLLLVIGDKNDNLLHPDKSEIFL